VLSIEKDTMFRKILYLVFIGIFVWYVFTHLPELHKLLHAFAQGSWLLLVLAAVIQLVFFAIYTLMTKYAFRVVHLKRKFFELVPLVFGSIFVNVLAPTAGQSGTILYADDAARRKESSPKAVIGSVIATIASYIAFSFILGFSLVYLKSFNMLNDYEVIGAIIFVFPTFIPGILIFTAHRSPKTTVKILNVIYRIYRKVMKIFHKKPKLTKQWPEAVANEFYEAADSISENRLYLAQTLALAFVAHVVNIVSLVIIFEAFEIKIFYGALIAGYAVGEMVRIISPNPEGVGVTEAAMAVIFASFGVPLISATAISIIFRAYNFWIPLAIGFAMLHRLRSFSNEKT
jgi:phosphatidylglycerol lysyltransferase